MRRKQETPRIIHYEPTVNRLHPPFGGLADDKKINTAILVILRRLIIILKLLRALYNHGNASVFLDAIRF